MLPSEASDLQLINQIKNIKDSDALVELANRHTGIYVNTLQRFYYLPDIEKSDLLEHKLYNIYNYAISYDEKRNVKFSTWISQNVFWQCKGLCVKISNKKTEEMTSEIENNCLDEHEEIDQEFIDFVYKQAKKIKDKRFYKIFKFRHKEKYSWEKIAQELSSIDGKTTISDEGVKKIYKRNLKTIQNKILKEIR